MHAPSLREKIQRIAIAHMHHVVAVWTTRPRTIRDPIVVVADSDDVAGRQFTGDVRHGAIVKVVSAAELGSKVPVLAHVTGKVDTRSLFVVCLAMGSSECAYVNQMPGGIGLESSATPGRPPIDLARLSN